MSPVRGIPTEVAVGPANGLSRDSVVNLDNVQTIPVRLLGARIGWLGLEQEHALTEGIIHAYDLLD